MTRVKVYVTLKPSVLDPQGQAVARSLGKLGFSEVKEARIGKLIELSIDGSPTEKELGERVEAMCKGLLANTVIESYRYEIADGAK